MALAQAVTAFPAASTEAAQTAKGSIWGQEGNRQVTGGHGSKRAEQTG